jgi:hypothetical protein
MEEESATPADSFGVGGDPPFHDRELAPLLAVSLSRAEIV